MVFVDRQSTPTSAVYRHIFDGITFIQNFADDAEKKGMDF
jgi:hypothetical protein